jgi:hypothetical protein
MVGFGPHRMGRDSRPAWFHGDGEHHIPVAGRIGFPFFRQLVRDCLAHSERAMTQAHIFHVAELTLRAQKLAGRAAKCSAAGME